jgi:endonuclease YncB( thermonuclease family)
MRAVQALIRFVVLASIAVGQLARAAGADSRLEWTANGEVVRILDGDTLAIRADNRSLIRVRKSGIDAPEKGQACGRRARQSLGQLAHERQAIANCDKSDRYGRRICRALVDGRDMGLEQFRCGLAWHFRRYAHEQSAGDRSAYATAEDEARAARRGSCSDALPVAPWQWRASVRSQ